MYNHSFGKSLRMCKLVIFNALFALYLLLECKSKCNFLNIKTRGTKTCKKSHFSPRKGTKTALKPMMESEPFCYSILSVFISFTAGLLWGEELVGYLMGAYLVACSQTRQHSLFIVSMTLSVVFAVLSYTHSLES